MRSKILKAGDSEKGEDHETASDLIFVFYSIVEAHDIQFPFDSVAAVSTCCFLCFCSLMGWNDGSASATSHFLSFSR